MNPAPTSHRAQRGTTLIELMIAIAILCIVAGAAFSLFNQQANSSSTLQGQVGLSLALRNTASQLQLDLANAGDGYFQGINIPSWPVGVTITNNWVPPGSSCYANGVYGANCFDQLNIISAADARTFPPTHATDANGLGLCSSTTAVVSGVTASPGSTTTVYAQAAPPTLVNPGGFTLAQTAAEFKAGDQLLFVSFTGQQITSAVLAANGTVAANGKVVALTIYQTQSDGSNITGSPATDPLNITTCDRGDTTTVCNPSNLNNQNNPNFAVVQHSRFATSFCATDWIIKLAPIQYYVAATTDPQNPWQLIRKQNGIPSVVMDQIIGFKVGAAIWNANLLNFNNASANNNTNFFYNASQYAITDTAGGGTAVPYNYTLIRAVRASIIGRTAPNNDSAYTYRNTFDGGPYQVQGTAIVVNPRNMSMNDN